MLGDKIEKLTEAVGVKSCEDCKKRKELLNEISRRGFVKSGVAGLSYLLLSTKLKAQSIVALPDTSEALNLVRAVGTIQEESKTNNGEYGTKEDIIKRLLQTQHSHAHEETDTGVWARSLNLESRHIMPAWDWDYASKPEGFVLIVSATAQNTKTPRAVYILDQNGPILRTDTEGPIPPAYSLNSASDFPGAEPYDSFVGEERQTWASKALLWLGLDSVVKAAGRCSNNSACCLCCQRFGGSCGSTHGGNCYFFCGSTDCSWCQKGSGSFCCCTNQGTTGCCEVSCACGAGGVCATCKCCVCTNSC